MPLSAITQLPKPELTRRASQAREHPLAKGWDIFRLEDAFRDCQAPPFAIEDLVLDSTLTLVSARPHAMKSLSWLYACMEGVLKKEVFGHFKAPNLNNVLFLETEDPAYLVKKRIQGFALGLGVRDNQEIPGFNFACPGPFNLLDEIHQLAYHINSLSLDLIVISTLQNILGGRDWNEQEAMADMLEELVRTARLCPIVLITHSPHNPNTKRAAGTITLGANCATHLHLTKKQTPDRTCVSVELDSKAGGSENKFSLDLVSDRNDDDPVRAVRGFVYAGPLEKAEKQQSKGDAVLEVLTKNPYVSAADLAALAKCSLRYAQRIRKEHEAPPSR
jgi:hypothetical protein